MTYRMWKRISIGGGFLVAVVLIAAPGQGLSCSETIAIFLAGGLIGFIWSIP